MSTSPGISCSVDGCDKSGKLIKGMCRAHYTRMRRGADLTKPLRPYAPGGTCAIDGCERPNAGKGHCKMHGKRRQKHGDPNVVKQGGPGRGEENHAWLGDAVTYTGAHFRVVRSRGSATLHACLFCKKQANDWAYDHTDPNPLSGYRLGSLLEYSGDPKHYIPLCTPCHLAWDAQHRKTQLTQRLDFW